MNDNTHNSSGSVGFGGLLTLLFIGLKLTNFIDWSWWWVLSPMWIMFLLILVGVVVDIFIGIISE